MADDLKDGLGCQALENPIRGASSPTWTGVRTSYAALHLASRVHGSAVKFPSSKCFLLLFCSSQNFQTLILIFTGGRTEIWRERHPRHQRQPDRIYPPCRRLPAEQADPAALLGLPTGPGQRAGPGVAAHVRSAGDPGTLGAAARRHARLL